jgi:hypothetical protein
MKKPGTKVPGFVFPCDESLLSEAMEKQSPNAREAGTGFSFE